MKYYANFRGCLVVEKINEKKNENIICLNLDLSINQTWKG